MKRIFLPLWCILLFYSVSQAQHQPYPVHETKPVIMQDPYLIDPSETGMTIAWKTDTPAHSKVVYGKKGEDLDQIAENQEHGLLKVGTMHTVRIDDLEPGTTYQYKVMSRRVVQLKPYWPEMGHWVESEVYSFTTFDKEKPEIAFSAITDIHESNQRINTFMNLIDWDQTDFLVHTGDAYHYLSSEEQVFSSFLTSIAKGLKQEKPLVYIRGNHELRGPFARNLFDYIPIHEGRYYYARDHGPAHFIILDSGEDKPDSTNVYAGLNRLKEYREIEYKWFKNHMENDESVKNSPFRIILMHDPRWGWMDGENDKWTEVANDGKINLMISGHWHRFRRVNPGDGDGNQYPILVLGQQEIAHVKVNENRIHVEVRNTDDEWVDEFEIDRNGKIIDIEK